LQHWECVIGLEIHAELLSQGKIFCGCSTAFGKDHNSSICPVCLGLPGTLPVLNEKALELAIKTGLALNCQVAGYSRFARKNYFYPDLPKAYQISQYEEPICTAGKARFPVDGGVKEVNIVRVHMEEEAGKLLHSEDNIMKSEYTLIDYNRAGIPLIEIVTAPDLNSPTEARCFLEYLKPLLKYIEVSDCKMEEGSLRCDANVSVRPKGSHTYGNKVEIKNLNSFKAVERALEYEVKRQTALLELGESIIQETRHWNEAKGKTETLRTKESAHDYRYFRDPDLVPIVLEPEYIEAIKANLPELPLEKKERFMSSYDLPASDVSILISDRALADYFEDTVRLCGQPKTVCNWVINDVLRINKKLNKGFSNPNLLAELISLIGDKQIDNNTAKNLLEEVLETETSPKQIIQRLGLSPMDDTDLENLITQAIDENQVAVASYLAGKKGALGYIIGQIMKASKGRVNPKKVHEILENRLK
jgi:aspartyl-tRNA(Asn)/glutamyl-tRNA(Gln) amidotransferase subunit B